MSRGLRGRALLFRGLVLATASAGCYGYVESPAGSAAGASPNEPAAAGNANAGGGLPCGVKNVLEARCVGCHGATPSAPMSLVTYEDLVAPAKSNPALKVVDVSIARMRNDASPMPPSGSRIAGHDIS